MCAAARPAIWLAHSLSLCAAFGHITSSSRERSALGRGDSVTTSPSSTTAHSRASPPLHLADAAPLNLIVT
jgi:hypothetical protein